MFDLAGKVALVTGAGRGMGVGIAKLLAQQGAAVAVNDLVEERAKSTVEAIGGDGGRATAVCFDVTDPAAVAAGIERTEELLGPVDVLVNNAGIPPGLQVTQFREMDPKEWQQYIDLNLYGVLHCAKAVIDGMCERRWGRVITISSGAGQVGLALGISVYGAGKGAAISFMRHLALEVGRYGVTANSLALGLMDNASDEAYTQQFIRMIPAARLGTPEDVGAAVVYLASEEAGWITGQTIGLNGGMGTS